MTVLSYTDPRLTNIRGSLNTGILMAIEFDAVLVETHKVAAKATEHPVEKGAPISDHVRPELIKLSLTGCITNAPLLDVVIGSARGDMPLQLQGARRPITLTTASRQQVKAAAVSGGNNILSNFKVNGFGTYSPPVKFTPAEYITKTTVVTGNSLQFPVSVDRINAAYEILFNICQSGWLVQVSSKLKEYPSMLLVDVTAPRNPEDSLDFQLEFQEARFVDTQEVQITKKASKPKELRAEPTVAQGTTSTYDQDAGPDSDVESDLSRLTN